MKELSEINLAVIGLSYVGLPLAVEFGKKRSVVGFDINQDVEVDVYDPWVDAEEARHEYGITPVAELNQNVYDAIILAVNHDQFKAMGEDRIRALGEEEHILYDLKYLLSEEESDLRL